MTNVIRVLVLGATQDDIDCYWVIEVEVPDEYVENFPSDDNAHLMAAMLTVLSDCDGIPALAFDERDSSLVVGLFAGFLAERTVSVDIWNRLSAVDQLAYRGQFLTNASSLLRCSMTDGYNGLSVGAEVENAVRCLWHTKADLMLQLTDVLRAVQHGKITSQVERTAQYILTKLGAE